MRIEFKHVMMMLLGGCLLLAVIGGLVGDSHPILSTILGIMGLAWMILLVVLAVLALRGGKITVGKARSIDSNLLSQGEYIKLILVNGKRIADIFENDHKLSSEENKQIVLTSVALVYLLAEKETRSFKSRENRVEIANKMYFSLAHLLDVEEDYVVEFLTSVIKRFSLYASQLSLPGDAGLRGTLFWEYGRLVEKQSGAKVSQIEAAVVAKSVGDETAKTLNIAVHEENGKVGLGGWLSVFIFYVSTWTLLCCLSSLILLVMFISGDYKSNGDVLSFIGFMLLSTHQIAVFSLGTWLLILLARRRRMAIKVGVVFSAITLGIPWMLYLFSSRRIKNTLVRQ